MFVGCLVFAYTIVSTSHILIGPYKENLLLLPFYKGASGDTEGLDNFLKDKLLVN